MEQPSTPMITMRLMGKDYQVPGGLTIMTAIEYAGYKLVRGSGCRAGFCGACTAIYRKIDDHRLHTALACQTIVQDKMCLVQIPYVPIEKKNYDLEALRPLPNTILQYYPEVARCISCNTCSRSCPQGISVMDYIQAALRGDLERTAAISFDCIQCGICSSRCPVDIKHYHVGQLARRLYGKYLAPPAPHLANRLSELENGKYDADFQRLLNLPLPELQQLYEERELERVVSKHNANRQLGSKIDPVDFQDNIERVS